jgi:TM2 domain-containing membrane protein YozV
MDNLTQKLLLHIPGIENDELMFVKNAIKDASESEIDTFLAVYKSKRKDSQTILLTTLLGFLGVAGINRFILNNIGMGILYLLTGGLCLIGTIIDLVNYKKLTLEFNQEQILQATALSRQ